MTEPSDTRENAALCDAIASAVVSARHGRLADVADAILAMPEMQAIRACLKVCSDGHGWIAGALPPSVLAWIEAP